MDLPIGMKTRAPDMIMVTISGLSMRGEEVMTIKQRAAQNRVSSTHWVFVSGLRMDLCISDGLIKKRVDKSSFRICGTLSTRELKFATFY